MDIFFSSALFSLTNGVGEAVLQNEIFLDSDGYYRSRESRGRADSTDESTAVPVLPISLSGFIQPSLGSKSLLEPHRGG